MVQPMLVTELLDQTNQCEIFILSMLTFLAGNSVRRVEGEHDGDNEHRGNL